MKIHAMQNRLTQVWVEVSDAICAPGTGPFRQRVPLESCQDHQLLRDTHITGSQKQYDMDIYAAGKGMFVLQDYPHMTAEEVDSIIKNFFASRWGNVDCTQEVIASAKRFGTYNKDAPKITVHDVDRAREARRRIHIPDHGPSCDIERVAYAMYRYWDDVQFEFFRRTCGL